MFSVRNRSFWGFAVLAISSVVPLTSCAPEATFSVPSAPENHTTPGPEENFPPSTSTVLSETVTLKESTGLSSSVISKNPSVSVTETGSQPDTSTTVPTVSVPSSTIISTVNLGAKDPNKPVPLPAFATIDRQGFLWPQDQFILLLNTAEMNSIQNKFLGSFGTFWDWLTVPRVQAAAAQGANKMIVLRSQLGKGGTNTAFYAYGLSAGRRLAAAECCRVSTGTEVEADILTALLNKGRQRGVVETFEVLHLNLSNIWWQFSTLYDGDLEKLIEAKTPCNYSAAI